MDIGTLWTPSTLVCVASLGWKIAFFGCVEPFNFHDLKILGPSQYWDHVEVEYGGIPLRGGRHRSS